LDASPSLFTVMSAINAAGFDPDAASPLNNPLRAAVRTELAKRSLRSLGPLKLFVAQHHRRGATDELSQYISFALTCKGAPDFAVTQRSVDIPPDVSDMLELSPLLAAFYQEAHIEELWKRSQPLIDQEIARYHSPVTDAVLQSNLYLKQMTSGFSGRHFQIFIELLAPPGQIQTRSYGNEYTIVVTPSPEVRVTEIRHAYLHYLLDPLATRNAEILQRKKAVIDNALRAPALSESFKEDFLLLTTECLIKAVESRLDHKPEMVQQALLQGYILTPYFSEQLPIYEKQEGAMLVYYKEMVSAIDPKKEDARLSGVQFSNQTPQGHTMGVQIIEQPAEPLTGVEKTLDDAEQLYLHRDQDAANISKSKDLFLAALKETERKPLQAKAYYGLGRIAMVQKDPESAEKLLQKGLESDPEPYEKGWILVYLGRLYQVSTEPAQAAKFFQEALQVTGASDKARQAAQLGLQTITKK
jgi:tetratricopeptide (TPR) repeat protein